MENATRHAKERIAVSALREGGKLTLIIEDDGPGLDATARATVLARGKRLDEAGGGAGLGLAIVRDILAAYEGDLALEEADLGGLKAVVTLPA
ncbi:MAG: ATP-binding protein [Tepidamorphaceae bacterium]